MKIVAVSMLVSAGLVFASGAQTTIIDTDFTSPEYTQGADLIGQNDWMVAPNTAANAFDVINDSADTVSATGNFDTNTGNYAYLPSVSVGSAADTEWTGSMQFSASLTGTNYGAGDIFRIGTSSDPGSSTGLVSSVDTDVYLRVNRASNGRIRIQAHDASGDTVDMIEIEQVDAGWNVANNDFSSDEFVLDWTVRQTRVDDTFKITSSISNINTGVSSAGTPAYVVESAAYAAPSTRFVMGHSDGASYNVSGGSYDLAHITIGDLSFIQNTAVLPVLDKPEVEVSESDSIIDLSWDDAVETEEYDVKRSVTGIGGTYVIQASGLTTNGWQDAGLTNGDEYYYIVVAKATGAVDVESDPVLGSPFSPVTGTFLDTSFTGADDYIMGDLAGQDKWKSIPASDPMAFNVDTGGNGFAENESYSNQLAGVERQVFYNKPTNNGEGHIWEGTLDFSLKAAPADGLYQTNTYNTTVGTNTVTLTNIQQVVSLTGNDALLVGITSDESSKFQPKGNDDAIIVIKYTGSGDITFGLNQYNSDANLMLTLPRETVGWDPQWQDQPASNGPIFLTDPIALDWNIRKATAPDTYSAQVIATVGGHSYTSIVEYTDAGDSKNRPEDLYAADLARFAMGQKIKSENEQVYAIIDAMSVTHSDTSVTPIGVPNNLSGIRGNLSIDLSWSAGGEQDSFNVYRSEAQGGPYVSIATVTDQAYMDSGLTDLRTYFYVVTANYGASESAYSEEFIIRALGINNPLSFGQGDWCSDDFNFIGNGVSESTSDIYPFWSGTISTALPNNNSDFDLQVIAQETSNHAKDPIMTAKGIEDTVRMKLRDGGALLLWVEGAAVDTAGVSYELKTPDFEGIIYAVVRGIDNKWYAAQTPIQNDVATLIPDLSQEAWAEFTPATPNSTSLMAVTNGYAVRPGLTQISAAGFLCEGATTAARNFDYWKLNVGTQPSSYDRWSDSYGIYNEDAASTNDYDLDGANNTWEWGLGGDPTDSEDVGITDRFGGLDGANLVYIYPRLKNANARPEYTLLETDNLQWTEFSNQEDEYLIEAGGTWTNEPDFEAVTNVIPTTDTVKFIKLNVE